MTASPDDEQRLWDLSQRRADELGKAMQQIAEEAGVSTQALWKWRRGRSIRERTDRPLTAAFGWEFGSRQAILNGGEPTPIAETRPTPAGHLQIFEDPRQQRIWEQDDVLTEDERLDLIAYLRQRDQLPQVRNEVRRHGAG